MENLVEIKYIVLDFDVFKIFFVLVEGVSGGGCTNNIKRLHASYGRRTGTFPNRNAYRK